MCDLATLHTKFLKIFKYLPVLYQQVPRTHVHQLGTSWDPAAVKLPDSYRYSNHGFISNVPARCVTVWGAEVQKVEFLTTIAMPHTEKAPYISLGLKGKSPGNPWVFPSNLEFSLIGLHYRCHDALPAPAIPKCLKSASQAGRNSRGILLRPVRSHHEPVSGA